MFTSIIIPFFDKWTLTHQCLFDLYQHVRKEDVEIILVDDASTDIEIDGGVAWWQKTLQGGHTIRYIKHDVNGGFGKSMNDGCKMAKGDVVVLLSNDVRVSGDFVAPVVSTLQSNPKAFIGNEFLNRPTGWNEFVVKGKKGFVPYVNGWFIACTKDAWNEIGGFDLYLRQMDYEDVDISATAVSMGYNLVGINLPFLRHLGGQTVYPLYPNRQEYTIKNRQLFISKWGDRLESLLCPM